MPKKKEEMTPENDATTLELKKAMLDVGIKLCHDLMDGKARDEKTALTAITDIYRAVNGE